MALGLLTFDQIIVQGLQTAGNPGLNRIPAGYTESLAYTFLRLFLHHVFLTYDFSFLVTSASVSTGYGGLQHQIDLSALTRYRNIKALRLNTIKDALFQNQHYEDLWQQIEADSETSPVISGTPVQFAITPDKSIMVLYPIPNVAYTGKVLYYSMPNVSAFISSTVVPFEDSMALVSAVEQFARNYDKDTMVNLSTSIAHQLFGEYRAAQEDAGRQSALAVRLDPATFRYRRGQ